MMYKNTVQSKLLSSIVTVFTISHPYSTVQAADSYIRYDIKTDKADPGYPKPINSKTWRVCGVVALMP